MCGLRDGSNPTFATSHPACFSRVPKSSSRCKCRHEACDRVRRARSRGSIATRPGVVETRLMTEMWWAASSGGCLRKGTNRATDDGCLLLLVLRQASFGTTQVEDFNTATRSSSSEFATNQRRACAGFRTGPVEIRHADCL